MIHRNELIKIGNFKKLHGIKGEILLSFTNNCFEGIFNLFFICAVQGIFIPFKVKSYRSISNSTALIQLKHIDSGEKAHFLLHKEVFFSKKHWQGNREHVIYSWQNRMGFTLIDEKKGIIGQLIDINESTMNHLFILEKENEELIIPAAEKMIVKIDDDQKIIYMKLPEGLL